MHERLLLVIGSQCRKLNHLQFLPEVAARLHGLLASPGPGGCTGVPLAEGPPRLLLDPTVDQAKDAIEAAVDRAGTARAALVLAYIGHGEFEEDKDGDFYLMPTDAARTTERGAIHLVNFLNDCLKHQRHRPDLVVLLDACHAGVAAWKSMQNWATARRGDLGFELLTATDDRATANAPLARDLIEPGESRRHRPLPEGQACPGGRPGGHLRRRPGSLAGRPPAGRCRPGRPRHRLGPPARDGQ